MQRIPAVLCIWMGLASGVMAQEDPMAVQRCVWSCLSNFPPNTNPAYHQCVEDHCVPMMETQPEAPRPDRWQAGRIDGGRTAYAGVDSPDGNIGVYYFCDRAGRSELMIAGVPTTAGTWVLEVGGTPYSFAFAPRSNGVSTRVGRSDAVLAALRSGSRVGLQGRGLPQGSTLTLKGSSAAFSEALAFCR